MYIRELSPVARGQVGRELYGRGLELGMNLKLKEGVSER